MFNAFALCVVICHVTCYDQVWQQTFPVMRALRKLEYIHLATSIDDLRVPPGNRLHELKGDRAGLYSISINDRWRICFRFCEGDAYDVEIVDYH